MLIKSFTSSLGFFFVAGISSLMPFQHIKHKPRWLKYCAHFVAARPLLNRFFGIVSRSNNGGALRGFDSIGFRTSRSTCMELKYDFTLQSRLATLLFVHFDFAAHRAQAALPSTESRIQIEAAN